jgi:hypothetical protein
MKTCDRTLIPPEAMPLQSPCACRRSCRPYLTPWMAWHVRLPAGSARPAAPLARRHQALPGWRQLRRGDVPHGREALAAVEGRGRRAHAPWRGRRRGVRPFGPGSRLRRRLVARQWRARAWRGRGRPGPAAPGHRPGPSRWLPWPRGRPHGAQGGGPSGHGRTGSRGRGQGPAPWAASRGGGGQGATRDARARAVARAACRHQPRGTTSSSPSVAPAGASRHPWGAGSAPVDAPPSGPDRAAARSEPRPSVARHAAGATLGTGQALRVSQQALVGVS